MQPLTMNLVETGIEDVGHPRRNGHPCLCSECAIKRAALQHGSTCTPEERALISAIIAEEEAKTAAEDAIGRESDDEIDARVQLLGQCVAERVRAIQALMAVRLEQA